MHPQLSSCRKRGALDTAGGGDLAAPGQQLRAAWAAEEAGKQVSAAYRPGLGRACEPVLCSVMTACQQQASFSDVKLPEVVPLHDSERHAIEGRLKESSLLGAAC